MKSLLSRWLSQDQTPYGIGAEINPNFVDFPCEVTGCINHLEFTVRGDNGRAYKVHAAHCLTHLMGYHTRVRITGMLKDGMVWAESIIPLGQGKPFRSALARWRH